MFSFYKNTDILITGKSSMLSEISYKLEKKKIAVLIDSLEAAVASTVAYNSACSL